MDGQYSSVVRVCDRYGRCVQQQSFAGKVIAKQAIVFTAAVSRVAHQVMADVFHMPAGLLTAMIALS